MPTRRLKSPTAKERMAAFKELERARQEEEVMAIMADEETLSHLRGAKG